MAPEGHGSPLPAEPFRGPVVLVVSPHAGHASGGVDAAHILQDAGVAVGQRLLVNELDEHVDQGPLWREQGFRAAVAAGGDGTIGAVATHLRGSGLPLGILPFGTANDIARSLSIPLDLAEAARVIAAGNVMQIDGGEALPALTEPGALSVEGEHDAESGANVSGADTPSPMRGAYFLHALTLGMNVEFARLATDVARRQRWGPLTYAASAIESLKSYKPVPMHLRFDGLSEPEQRDRVEMESRAVQLSIVNTPVFGGSMEFRLPGVNLHDRLLDILLVEELDPAQFRSTVESLIAALGRLRESPHAGGVSPQESFSGAAPETATAADEMLGFALPGMRRFRARSVTIRTEKPMDITLDGEIRTHTPTRVRVTSEQVPIFVPKSEMLRQPSPVDHQDERHE